MHKVKARDFIRYPTGTEIMDGAGKWVAIAAVRWTEHNAFVKIRRVGSTQWEESSPEDTYTVRGDDRY